MARVDVDPTAPSAEIITRAAELLRAGRLVAFPTETVYGLGANALNPAAVERIYAAKGRPNYNPLIVHVLDEAAAQKLVLDWTEQAKRLAQAFWPGPLTLVLPKREMIPDAVTAGLASVAVRVPAHPVARALLAAARIPIAAPSANRSMSLSPTTGAHVEKSLGAAVDMILDAGPTPVGIESTVIDLSGTTPTILRPGTITTRQIEAVIGAVASPARMEPSAARPSPGMLDRHYAPRARLLLANTPDLPAVFARERETGARVAAVVIHPPMNDAGVVHMPNEPLAYASALYGVLHSLDDSGYDVIVAERVPETPEWRGVRDRLERGAA
jgi:L-threonylcarbamoyladenylate synthase